jgi:hypothetical protein
MVSVRGVGRFALAAAAAVAVVVACVPSAVAEPEDWAVSPTMLTFVPTPVGAISSVDVFVSNVGTQTRSPDVVGGTPLDAANFASRQGCQDRVLAPGDQCVFTFEFRPQSEGSWSTGATVLVDGATFFVQLSGVTTGATPTPGGSAGVAPGLTTTAPAAGRALTPSSTSGSAIAPAGAGSRQAAAVVAGAIVLALAAGGLLLGLAARRGGAAGVAPVGAAGGSSDAPPGAAAGGPSGRHAARGRHRARAERAGDEV